LSLERRAIYSTNFLLGHLTAATPAHRSLCVHLPSLGLKALGVQMDRCAGIRKVKRPHCSDHAWPNKWLRSFTGLRRRGLRCCLLRLRRWLNFGLDVEIIAHKFKNPLYRANHSDCPLGQCDKTDECEEAFLPLNREAHRRGRPGTPMERMGQQSAALADVAIVQKPKIKKGLSQLLKERHSGP